MRRSGPLLHSRVPITVILPTVTDFNGSEMVTKKVLPPEIIINYVGFWPSRHHLHNNLTKAYTHLLDKLLLFQARQIYKKTYACMIKFNIDQIQKFYLPKT